MSIKPQIVDPSVEDIKTALRLCAIDEPAEKYPCEDCYLYKFSRDGRMSTGRTCFEHLSLDAIALLDRLNDFDKTQSKKLLARLADMAAQLDAAVEDIPHLCGTCGKMGNCRGNPGKLVIKCGSWQWRDVQPKGAHP